MKLTSFMQCGLIALAAASALPVVSAQVPEHTHRVKVLYVIPQGETARPRASEAIEAMMAIVQQHYKRQLGRTFALKFPLVTTVNVSQDAAAAADWMTNYDNVRTHLSQDYLADNNVVLTIIEGEGGWAAGGWNLATMSRGFWSPIYDTYMTRPHLLAQKVAVVSHVVGLAFGLMHTSDTKRCLADRGVDMGELPNLLLQMTGDFGTAYNYPFHELEKRLLLEPDYYPECRPLLNGRPHSSNHLRYYSVPVYPSANGRNVNRIEVGYAPGVTYGEYRLKGREWWSGNRFLNPARLGVEQQRDDWSVYIYNPEDGTHIQLDLFTKKAKHKTLRGEWEFDILDASARVNGSTARQVFYTNNSRGDEAGVFVQGADGIWREESLPQRQTRFEFIEVKRDDWSVYLFDLRRNLQVRLRLDEMRIDFKMANETDYQFLYPVLLAQ